MFPVRFIHAERLNEELHDFLLGLDFAAEELKLILDSGKTFPPEGGRSKGKPWQEYYTPELKQKVRTKERLLFIVFPEFDL